MLYLLRHGATEQPTLRGPGDFTPASREEWLLDFGLSARGRAEAGALGERLRRLSPADRVLSSPRRRTLETAHVALPGVHLAVDERLHEWHEEETLQSLSERVRWLLALGEEETVFAFTHGGFIRAVLAWLVARGEEGLFGATFEGFRRAHSVWNGSLTMIGHGVSGPEVLAVNLCPPVEFLAGRP